MTPHLSVRVRVPGKWVLAGEHAVLRGVRAVTLPHPQFFLEGGVPVAQGSPELGRILRELLAPFNVTLDPDYGVRSTIPVGGGLGSSAALCVLAARLVAETRGFESGVQAQDWILQTATQLEDRFHGKSSGMDVAAVLTERPTVFRRGEKPQAMTPAWEWGPWVSFHDTGHRMGTAQAVRQVGEQETHAPASFTEGLRAMERATECAIQAFQAPQAPQGIPLIAQAMDLSWQAFQAWGLVPEAVLTQARELREQGAQAVKLTGAGGGGFLVALWPKPR